MSQEIFFWEYELKRKKIFHTKAQIHPYKGLLIRIGGGYACVHPWEVYGDDSLEEQKKALLKGGGTPLVEQALYFAKRDADAREKGVSLFDSLEIPPSHGLITNIDQPESDMNEQLTAFVEEGFQTLKIKVGTPDLDQELKRLEKLCWAAEGKDIKFRLDFNGRLSQEEVKNYLSRFSQNFLDRVDFIEDPCAYDPLFWKELQAEFSLRFARDWFESDSLEGFEVYVIKPAKQNWVPYAKLAADEMKRICVTSYMEHPVGQAFAAWEAAQLYRKHPLLLDDCGLLTHQLFEADDFTRAMKREGPLLRPPEGTGIGFDEILASLDWKKLQP